MIALYLLFKKLKHLNNPTGNITYAFNISTLSPIALFNSLLFIFHFHIAARDQIYLSISIWIIKHWMYTMVDKYFNETCPFVQYVSQRFDAREVNDLHFNIYCKQPIEAHYSNLELRHSLKMHNTDAL